MKVYSRRNFVFELVGLGASISFPGYAQITTRPKRVVQIASLGQLLPEVRRETLSRFDAHGLKEGRDFIFEIVDTSASGDSFDAIARRVLESKPDLVMVGGADNPGALKRLTHNIPVVFYGTPDPVRSGLVESFNRPGGNLTGTSTRAYELAAKRLEILLEVSPRSQRVAVLRLASPTNELFFAELLGAAKKTSATVVDIPVLTDASLKALIDAIQKARADAVLLTFGMNENGRGLFEWLANHGVPSISPWIADVKAGGLLSLGEPLDERIARAVGIAVRVLRGEKPATIPVDQLSRFHLAINARTARKLRLRIPESIRVRADEVIE